MNELLIFHGSDHRIERPVYGMGREDNDYGPGFYCTEWVELAKEWACFEKGKDGFANAYMLNMEGLRILNLSDENYHILHWLALLLDNRRFSITAPIASASRQYILDHFLLDLSPYDIVIGYRADDSYFAFAKDFINNTISLSQLSRAMHLGKLGEQVVLKTEKAFSALHFSEEKCEFADSRIYYPLRIRRDQEARAQYLVSERQEEVINGLYISDIMRKDLANGDFSKELHEWKNR